MEDRVLKMRHAERTESEKHSGYPVHYQYQSELVSIRRKGFFPLWQAKSLLLDLIPTLSHESDGLIFQVCSADLKEEVSCFRCYNCACLHVRESRVRC